MAFYKLTQKFPQKRAFITGAASGLGKAVALALAKDGWRIGIADINYAQLLETASQIQKLGGQALPFELNVADKIQYEQVAHEFLAQTQGIDLLFNNAGVGDGGLIGEYTLENWEWIVSINQMGVVYGCHFFVPVMKKQQSGHIINTASIASVAAMPKMGPYNFTKAAILALSETLYGELLEHKVGVSCVIPYFFKTNITQYARGGELVKVMGQKMLDESKFTADEIAHQVLVKAGKGKLHLVLIKDAHFIWNFKRLWPMAYLKAVWKRYKKQEAMVEEMKVKV